VRARLAGSKSDQVPDMRPRAESTQIKTVMAVLATASFTSSLSIWCDPTGQSGIWPNWDPAEVPAPPSQSER
jgi:hypothetical protein